MSRFGVRQLERLTLYSCPWAGSSKGARAFKDKFLDQFRADNPEIRILEVEQRSREPTLLAEYRNRRTRSVDIRRKDEKEILRLAYLLGSSAGRKTTKPLDRHVVPKVVDGKGVVQASSSIQGRWTPGLSTLA